MIHPCTTPGVVGTRSACSHCTCWSNNCKRLLFLRSGLKWLPPPETGPAAAAQQQRGECASSESHTHTASLSRLTTPHARLCALCVRACVRLCVSVCRRVCVCSLLLLRAGGLLCVCVPHASRLETTTVNHYCVNYTRARAEVRVPPLTWFRAALHERVFSVATGREDSPGPAGD